MVLLTEISWRGLNFKKFLPYFLKSIPFKTPSVRVQKAEHWSSLITCSNCGTLADNFAWMVKEFGVWWTEYYDDIF